MSSTAVSVRGLTASSARVADSNRSGPIARAAESSRAR